MSEATASEPEETAPASDRPAEVEPTKEARRDEGYRVQLRQTEAERDALRGALLPHLRALIERRAADRLADGSSIWVLGDLDPMSLLGGGYELDAERIDAAVDRLLTHAPRLGQQVPAFDGGARQSAAPGGPSWSKLITGQ